MFNLQSPKLIVNTKTVVKISPQSFYQWQSSLKSQNENVFIQILGTGTLSKIDWCTIYRKWLI
jgi:hypothetical protein